jgi:hypothetical protein
MAVNSSIVVNELIDALEDDLDTLRTIPAWGIALIVLTSLISCCFSCGIFAAFVIIPMWEWNKARAQRIRASKLLEHNIQMPAEELRDVEEVLAEDAKNAS